MNEAKRQHLIQVKRALAEKYDRRASQASSHNLARSLRNKADRYARQVQRLETLG